MARGISGPKSFYRRKHPKSFPVLLTPEGHKLLKQAIRRTKCSRNDVLERLVRRYGPEVQFEESNLG